MKLQYSVAPPVFSGLWLLTFYTLPQNSLDWQGLFWCLVCVIIMTGFWSFVYKTAFCYKHYGIVSSQCTLQYKPIIISSLGRKIPEIVYWHFFWPGILSPTVARAVSAAVTVSLQQQCWTKGPHRHKDAVDLPSAVICHWWLISKAARVVPEQHLIPFPPSFAELSCGVTCPASALILYSSALLPRLNRETQR